MTPQEYQDYVDKMAADADKYYDRIEASEAQPGPSKDAATSTGNNPATDPQYNSDTSHSTSDDLSNGVDSMDDFDDFDDDLF
ncbi:hypothetical protein [Streptomyces sp. NPDC091027]|uniref:hypothetical protein n=1 Tax=Streptomyces sp. NPDC091027 TaxID=3365971 RepID=UPI003809BB0C